MVIVLLSPRNLGNLAKTQVVFVTLVEGKNYIHKILSQLYHVGDPLRSGKSNHRFCWMNRNRSDFLKTFCEVPKQGNSQLRFAIEELIQR